MKNTSCFLLSIVLFLWGNQVICSDKIYWDSPKGFLHSQVLEGSDYEIGYAGAKASGITYDETVPNEIRHTFYDFLDQVPKTFGLRFIAKTYYDSNVLWRMAIRIPNREKDFLKGVSDFYDVKKMRVRKGYVIPDAFHIFYRDAILLTKMNETSQKDKNTITKILAESSNCSSFSAYGNMTKTGERIVGRNLDYMGLGNFDEATGVYLIKPDDGYAHIAVAPLGYPLSAITGMNEYGLTLVVHSVYADKYRIYKSRPIMSVNKMVLMQAKNIEEAIEVYKNNRVFTGWMIHLTDRDKATGQARSAVIELHPDNINVVWGKNNYTVVSNHYLSEKQQKRMLTPYIGVHYHNYDRSKRLDDLVKSGDIDIQKAISILQDSFSLYSNTPVDYSPSSLLVPNQINSVVFLPDQLKILVAEGPTPSSYSNYYEFGFNQMEKNDRPKLFIPTKNKPTEGFKEYVKAYYANTRLKDDNLALDHLKNAYTLVADCSYNLLYASRLIRNKQYADAQAILNKSLECNEYNPQQKALTNFYLGLLGQNKKSGNKTVEYLNKAKQISESTHFKKLIDKILEKGEITEEEIDAYANIDYQNMDTSW